MLHLSLPAAKQQAHFYGNGDGDFMPQSPIRPPLLTRGLTVRFLAIALLFGGPLAVFKALISALPPDFTQRWCTFFEEHSRKQPLASNRRRKKSSIIYDIHGEVVATVGSTSEPSSCNLNSQGSSVPAFLWQAVVACEDRRFFQHRGVDPRGLARAALSFSSNGGGSTITQQVVKNVFLSSERKWTRKLLEMFLALILESRMSKWDILQTYLKKIYWGHGNYGVDAASEFYFGKHVSLLNIGECAMLAGMIPAPEIFSPFHDASRGKRAQGRALRRMVEVGFLDTSYAEAIFNEPLELTVGGEARYQSPCKAPFFVDEVLKDLNERYGCNKVLEGGLKVYTTLDLKMQELAEEVVNERVALVDREQMRLTELDISQIQEKLEELQTTRNLVIKKVTAKIYSEQSLDYNDASKLVEQVIAKIDGKFSARKETLLASMESLQKKLKTAVCARLEAALVAIDHSDGGVRVLIGGRDYVGSKFNWSTEAYRPPGSAFKPVVYLTALAEKMSVKDVLRGDVRIPEVNFAHERKVSSGKIGKQSASRLSEPCVKLCSEVGADKVCRMGNDLGIKTPLPCDAKLAQGGFKITPMQLATVYSTIASGGIYHKPFFITRVETANGEILEENKTSEAVRVVGESVIMELKKVVQVQQERRWTKRHCVGHMVPADGHQDAWLAGFARDITCVVWLGYDDHRCAGLHLHPGSGVSQAAKIWKHFMIMIYKDQPKKMLSSWRMCPKRPSRSLFKVHRNRMKLWQKALREKEDDEHGRLPWKDVWDWDKASSVWDERESMVEWTEKHLERSAKVNAFKRIWS